MDLVVYGLNIPEKTSLTSSKHYYFIFTSVFGLYPGDIQSSEERLRIQYFFHLTTSWYANTTAIQGDNLLT